MADIQANAAKLGTEPVGKLLLKYSIPAVIAMIVNSLYNIIDRIFIGNGVGAMAISGLTLTFPLMTMIAAIGTLVGVGASTRVSIVLGMKDLKWAKNILGNALFLTFIMSALLVIPVMFNLEAILRIFGGTENTIPYAVEYLRIVIPGSVLMNLSFSFAGIMRASGYPNKSMITILIGVILNVILDPILIFGFDMGIKGAAVATIVSMFVSAVFVMFHFFNKRSYVHFEKDSFRLKRRIIYNITTIGLAPFLMNLMASMVNIIMNNQLLKYGGDFAIGAYGIINSYAIFIVMAVMGICQGMQPILGYNYGAGKLKRMKETLKLGIASACVIMIVGFIAGETIPYLLAAAFTGEQQLIDLTGHGMRIVFLAFPLIGFQIVVTQFFQSIGKAWQAIIMSLSRQLIFLIPFLLLFGWRWKLTGVWFAIPVSDFLSVVMAVFFLGYAKRKLFYPNFKQRQIDKLKKSNR